jgi:hypothetical protein
MKGGGPTAISMKSDHLPSVMPVPGPDPGIVAGIHAFPLPTLPACGGG